MTSLSDRGTKTEVTNPTPGIMEETSGRFDQTDQHFCLTIDNLLVPIIVCRASDTRILYANSQAATLFTPGDRQALHGTNMKDYITIAAEDFANLTKNGRLPSAKSLCKTRAGNGFSATLSASFMVFAREPCFCLIIRDHNVGTTDAPKIENRHALAIDSAKDGIWDWDLEKDQIYFSEGWKKQLGYEAHQLADTLESWHQLVVADDLANLRSSLKAHSEGKAAYFQHEYRAHHKNGDVHWFALRGSIQRSPAGKAVRFVGLQSDVTERHKAEEYLLEGTLHDGITGLPSRIIFEDRLERALLRLQRRSDYLFAILCLDPDLPLNEAGEPKLTDEMLIEISFRLQSCLRNSDTAARIENNLFGVILDDIREMTDAVRISDRILTALSVPFKDGREQRQITFHMGVIVGEKDYERATDIVHEVISAAAQARIETPGSFLITDPSIHVKAQDTSRLDAELREAIAKHQFRVHFQPIVNVTDQRIAGFEALVRWSHPQAGLLLPGVFLKAAEESGLILKIGDLVLRDAVERLREWRKKFPLKSQLFINVNLSRAQLMDGHLVEKLYDVLGSTGLPANLLRLDLPESIMVDDVNVARTMLSQLKCVGVSLAVDDFGVGYSSLAGIEDQPFDSLKIEGRLIRRMTKEPRARGLVRSIISFAQTLGISVCAEGVETATEYDYLREFGCELAMGQYFSKPVDAVTAETMLKEGKNW